MPTQPLARPSDRFWLVPPALCTHAPLHEERRTHPPPTAFHRACPMHASGACTGRCQRIVRASCMHAEWCVLPPHRAPDWCGHCARPVAPVILAESIDDLLDISGFRAPFMSFAPVLSDAGREILSSVAATDEILHLDGAHCTVLACSAVEARVDSTRAAAGSARIQTVEQRESPWLHAVLTRVAEFTGLGILLNTSLNQRGRCLRFPCAMLCSLRMSLSRPAYLPPSMGVPVCFICMLSWPAWLQWQPR
jgi:hypothetical protein